VAGKQYVVLREFRRVDKNGEIASYAKNDVYSGPVDATYLDPSGPDGNGPLVAEKAAAPIPASSDSKEKS
jgi:hypothetical protein